MGVIGKRLGIDMGSGESSKDRLRKLIPGIVRNGKLAELIIESITRIKSIATVGPEPTQPHYRPGSEPLTPIEVNDIIGITTYITNILLTEIKNLGRI
ncbi:hypothetical protein [Vulcanisaeta distributa]|uniref:FO synthase subunit 1 n=1 Tax=Vulcanisaeta distributa (strain DSM 14429 / JCM 11212 / NBRC 100878 / IC-017) TaxID=572478 RepID=E1QSD1_VULDI|nr:hypothetical protein [Vulcanisaeta distributa]ADN49524.1 FO synthase subunit 1 [Vulcanisaeta distributa DSM 14429]